MTEEIKVTKVRGVKAGTARGEYDKSPDFELRKTRGMKFTDDEWDNLKKLGGPKWVRNQIEIALKKV